MCIVGRPPTHYVNADAATNDDRRLVRPVTKVKPQMVMVET